MRNRLSILEKNMMKSSLLYKALVMNLFLRVGNKNNSCIRGTQENSIENLFTN